MTLLEKLGQYWVVAFDGINWLVKANSASEARFKARKGEGKRIRR